MADFTPYWFPGETLTCHAGAAITGGRIVCVDGQPVDDNPRVIHEANPASAIGIAARDKAVGEKVMVFAGRGVIGFVQASAAVTAKQHLTIGVDGRVAPVAGAAATTQESCAIALKDAASGADCLIMFLGPTTTVM